MKRILVICMFIALPVMVFAQVQPQDHRLRQGNDNALVDDPLFKKPSVTVLPPPNMEDSNPIFPGIYSSANNETQYYADHIKYPADALAAHLTGMVKLSSVIDEEGNVTEIKVIKSLSPSTDAEAIRLVSLPKWTPAKKNGRYVTAKWQHEVYFRL